MRDSESDSNLIKDFNESETEKIQDSNKCTKHKKIIIISVSIVLVLIIIAIVLFFTVFRNNNNSDDYDFSPSEIDIFTKEELDKARNAFRQFKYTDTINNSYILDYNLFIPENYTKEKKYPLIMFIHDGSFVQKTDVKSTLTDTVGGPI